MSLFTIIAHRGGARGKFKENSSSAFNYAINKGFQCIEMDLRLDHFNQRFYLEHDFIHLPRVKENIFEKIIPLFPKEATLFTELKTYTLTRTFYARTFCDLIKKHNLEKQIIVISFNPFVLKQIKKIAPHIKLGFLCGTELTYTFLRGYCKKYIDPEYFILSRRIISATKVKFARKNGYKVLSYVANRKKDWLKAKNLEIDGIITDYPNKAIKFFK